MDDRRLDEMLARAGAAPDVDPALLQRISASLQGSLGPVRPLPPRWVLAAGLSLISAALAFAGAAALGLHGIRRLTAPEAALIFSALAVFTWLVATLSTAEMTPGSRRRLGPLALLAIVSLALVGVFGLLFHDYRTERFVSQGLACLKAGLLNAVPAGIAGWLLLRRGFAVNPGAAGLAIGTLASLAGVTMLELHCANVETLHVMVWHTAVIPLSAGAGALVARAALRH